MTTAVKLPLSHCLLRLLNGPPVRSTKCRCVIYICQKRGGRCAFLSERFNLREKLCCRFAAEAAANGSVIQFLIAVRGKAGTPRAAAGELEGGRACASKRCCDASRRRMLAAVLAAVACPVGGAIAQPRPPMPPPRREVRPARPRGPRRWHWSRGRWRWNGRRWAWTSGRWR
jgi:hypothetical protein